MQLLWLKLVPVKNSEAMAPKAKGAPKAKAAPRVARAKGLPRGSSSGLVAHNAARAAVQQARPGSFRACPGCGAAVHVPDAAPPPEQIRCPVRAVRTAGSTEVYECGFKTKPAAWRRRSQVPADRAAARTLAVRNAIMHFETERMAGRIPVAGFWRRVLEESARRVPLVGALPADDPQAGAAVANGPA